MIRCWHGCLSEMKCKLFAYGLADATASPSFLASLKSRMVLPFWCWLTQVVLEKRSLNGCLSSTACLPSSVATQPYSVLMPNMTSHHLGQTVKIWSWACPGPILAIVLKSLSVCLMVILMFFVIMC